jgi:carboxyl-terminal processing protease
MMKPMWLLGALLLAVVANAGARADDAPPAQPYVVLVGIDKFQDPQIKPRRHAEADASALYELFRAKDHLGVPADNIKLLLGATDGKLPSEKATRANILKALEWLEKTAPKNSLVIFGYLGEGAPVGERSCFFAVDSTYKGRAKDAVPGSDIAAAFDKLQHHRLVAFLDLSLRGFDPGKEKMPDPNLQNFYKDLIGEDVEKGPAQARIVFLANAELKASLDLDKHGLFTRVLLDGLNGKADTDGYEADGNITTGELAKYVRKTLHNVAIASGKTDDQKSQTPAVLIEGPDPDFIFSHNPAAYPKAQQRLDKFNAIAKEQKLPRDVVEEGHDLLSRMPKLEARQNLRKAYEKLADGTSDVAAFTAARKQILDATVLTDRDAGNFAVIVMHAIKLVRQNFFKDVTQGDLVEQAVRGLFKHTDEKLPSAIEERFKGVKGMKDVDLVKLLTEARLQLGKREDLAKGKDVTFSLQGMLGKLDKHTDYIDPDLVQRLSNDLEGQFFGIGVQIRKNNIRDQLQVVTPIWNSPAYKKGLKANDIITTIIREVDSEGKPLAKPETLPTKGMTTEEAVKKILGKEGSPIKIVVDREGTKEPLTFNLIRGRVEVESVLGAKRGKDDAWNYVVDPENKICYVRLTQFSRNTYRDLERVMKGLYHAGIKGFVLDLRFNPGGRLEQAVKISDLFIDDGLIVSIRPRSGPETTYVGQSKGSYITFPMVCLVNGGSASASEIVSACLQDHGRAIVVGTRSYGKGSVQTIFPFETGGQIKVTTATFWRPSNRNLNKASTKGRKEDEWGVTPDTGYDVELSPKELSDLQDHLREAEIIRDPAAKKASTTSDSIKVEFHDRQLDSALQYLRAQIRTAAQGTAKKAG